MASRTEPLLIVGPKLSEADLIKRFTNLLIREHDFEIQVEHQMSDGNTQVLTFVIQRVEDQAANLSAFDAVRRPSDEGVAPNVFGFEFDGWVSYGSPNKRIHAHILLHWENKSAGVPVYGWVDLDEPSRPILQLPGDEPLS